MTSSLLITNAVKPLKVAKRLRKKKNFWELANLFDDFAVGTRFIRNIWWNKPETYWTVTRVIPYRSNVLPTGIAYGYFTYMGQTEPKERKIRCTSKRGWRFVAKDEPVAHWPMWNRKDMDMNHLGYSPLLKEKYYDIVQ